MLSSNSLHPSRSNSAAVGRLTRKGEGKGRSASKETGEKRRERVGLGKEQADLLSLCEGFVTPCRYGLAAPIYTAFHFPNRMIVMRFPFTEIASACYLVRTSDISEWVFMHCCEIASHARRRDHTADFHLIADRPVHQGSPHPDCLSLPNLSTQALTPWWGQEPSPVRHIFELSTSAIPSLSFSLHSPLPLPPPPFSPPR